MKNTLIILIIIFLVTSFSYSQDNIKVEYNLVSKELPALTATQDSASINVFPIWEYEARPIQITIASNLANRLDDLESVLAEHFNNVKGSPFCPEFQLITTDYKSGKETPEPVENPDNLIRLAKKNELLELAKIRINYDYIVSYYNENSIWARPVIQSVQITLRDDFFKRKDGNQERDLAAAFQHLAGHYHSTWFNDLVISGSVSGKFPKSWKEAVSSRNTIVYCDPVADPVRQPLLAPAENEILNLSRWNGPEDVLFITNFDAINHDVKITFYRLDDSGKSLGKLLKIKGQFDSFPYQPAKGKTLHLEASSFALGFGKSSKVKSLNKKLERYGKKKKLSGVRYSKALKIRVEVEGFLQPENKQGKISRDFWLVLE